MLLHRIHLDLRSREARRDVADPYQMHATLCRAFSPPETRCPAGAVLWRLEPEMGAKGRPRVLVQSALRADWSRIGVPGWLASAEPPVDLMATQRLGLPELAMGRRFRFRLRANPCVTRNGKRLGLMRLPEQEEWLMRQGARHGFSIPSADGTGDCRPAVRVSQAQMIRARQHGGNGIRVFSVLYDGVLVVSEPVAFLAALAAGIGHAKSLGHGLLSLAPAY